MAGVVEVQVATSVVVLVKMDPDACSACQHRRHVHELALVERGKLGTLSGEPSDGLEGSPLRRLVELQCCRKRSPSHGSALLDGGGALEVSPAAVDRLDKSPAF
jgi:hypothetical protein